MKASLTRSRYNVIYSPFSNKSYSRNSGWGLGVGGAWEEGLNKHGGSGTKRPPLTHMWRQRVHSIPHTHPLSAPVPPPPPIPNPNDLQPRMTPTPNLQRATASLHLPHTGTAALTPTDPLLHHYRTLKSFTPAAKQTPPTQPWVLGEPNIQEEEEVERRKGGGGGGGGRRLEEEEEEEEEEGRIQIPIHRMSPGHKGGTA